jgi:hypothetical protein
MIMMMIMNQYLKSMKILTKKIQVTNDYYKLRNSFNWDAEEEALDIAYNIRHNIGNNNDNNDYDDKFVPLSETPTDDFEHNIILITSDKPMSEDEFALIAHLYPNVESEINESYSYEINELDDEPILQISEPEPNPDD